MDQPKPSKMITGRAYTSKRFIYHVLPGSLETVYTSVCGISSTDWHDITEKYPNDIEWDSVCKRCKIKSMPPAPGLPYSGQRVLEVKGVSSECWLDLELYLGILEVLTATASKHTHYQNLDEWLEASYGPVHTMLDKYGFINGDVVANSKNPNASFWWGIYSVVSNVIYSPNLVSVTANHHSSAWERNEALKKDIQAIINNLNNNKNA